MVQGLRVHGDGAGSFFFIGNLALVGITGMQTVDFQPYHRPGLTMSLAEALSWFLSA